MSSVTIKQFMAFLPMAVANRMRLNTTGCAEVLDHGGLECKESKITGHTSVDFQFEGSGIEAKPRGRHKLMGSGCSTVLEHTHCD